MFLFYAYESHTDVVTFVLPIGQIRELRFEETK